MLTMLKERPSIVLVDGSPAIRSIMQRALSLAFPDHPIVMCAESAQVLEMLPHLPTSIVVTEYAMQGMPGLNLCQVIRHIAPQTYLIATTALPDPLIQDACEQAGVDACLS